MPEDGTDLLHHFPQIALNVCLLADGARILDAADHPIPGTCEIELLGPAHHVLVTFDAADPLVVLQARTALAERIDPWLHDTDHPTGDHPPCRTCPVQQHCGSALATHAGIVGTLHDLTPAAGLDWDHRTDQTLHASLDDTTTDEDIPF